MEILNYWIELLLSQEKDLVKAMQVNLMKIPPEDVTSEISLQKMIIAGGLMCHCRLIDPVIASGI